MVYWYKFIASLWPQELKIWHQISFTHFLTDFAALSQDTDLKMQLLIPDNDKVPTKCLTIMHQGHPLLENE